MNGTSRPVSRPRRPPDARSARAAAWRPASTSPRRSPRIETRLCLLSGVERRPDQSVVRILCEWDWLERSALMRANQPTWQKNRLISYSSI